MSGSRKERKLKGGVVKEGLKDPFVPLRECTVPKIEGPEGYHPH